MAANRRTSAQQDEEANVLIASDFDQIAANSA